MKQNAEAEEKKRKSELRSMENRILQREESLDHRNDALDKREHQLSSLQGQLDRRKMIWIHSLHSNPQSLSVLPLFHEMKPMMS